jgi:hypothetical protein
MTTDVVAANETARIEAFSDGVFAATACSSSG